MPIKSGKQPSITITAASVNIAIDIPVADASALAVASASVGQAMANPEAATALFASAGVDVKITSAPAVVAVVVQPPPVPYPTTQPDYECCVNDCAFNFDGYCDDGGPGSYGTFCTFGTDCDDCGDRCVEPSPGAGGGGFPSGGFPSGGNTYDRSSYVYGSYTYGTYDTEDHDYDTHPPAAGGGGTIQPSPGAGGGYPSGGYGGGYGGSKGGYGYGYGYGRGYGYGQGYGYAGAYGKDTNMYPTYYGGSSYPIYPTYSYEHLASPSPPPSPPMGIVTSPPLTVMLQNEVVNVTIDGLGLYEDDYAKWVDGATEDCAGAKALTKDRIHWEDDGTSAGRFYTTLDLAENADFNGTLLLCYRSMLKTEIDNFGFVSQSKGKGEGEGGAGGGTLFQDIRVAVLGKKVKVSPKGTGVDCASDLMIESAGYQALMDIPEAAASLTCEFDGLGSSPAYVYNDTIIKCTTPTPTQLGTHSLTLTIGYPSSATPRPVLPSHTFPSFGVFRPSDFRVTIGSLRPAGGAYNLEVSAPRNLRSSHHLSIPRPLPHLCNASPSRAHQTCTCARTYRELHACYQPPLWRRSPTSISVACSPRRSGATRASSSPAPMARGWGPLVARSSTRPLPPCGSLACRTQKASSPRRPTS